MERSVKKSKRDKIALDESMEPSQDVKQLQVTLGSHQPPELATDVTMEESQESHQHQGGSDCKQTSEQEANLEHQDHPSERATLSYKEKLTTNEGFGSYLGLDNPSMYELDDDIIDEDDKDKDCPNIFLIRDDKLKLRKPWIQSLIIKLWGKTVGYNYLLRKLKSMWNIKSHFDLIALENNYYLVRFTSAMEYAFAKQQVPWMILDHYLVVKEWSPNFDPSVGKTINLMV